MAPLNSRRGFVRNAALAAVSFIGVDQLLRSGTAASQSMVESERVQVRWTIQLGDARNGRAVAWSRADGASRLVVEWMDNARFEGSCRTADPSVLGCNLLAESVYARHVPYGPDLDVFVLDTQSNWAANGSSNKTRTISDTRWLAAAQLQWLKDALRCSTAKWKVVVVDVPLGVVGPDGNNGRCVQRKNSGGSLEARQFDVAHLLRHIKAAGVDNVVWLTAGVHHCAAHYYDPAAARFTDFEPFWEFVAGPGHATIDGPCELDDTFGPLSVFERTAPRDRANSSRAYSHPGKDFSCLGKVNVEPGGPMTVSFADQDGALLFAQVLEPAPASRKVSRQPCP